MKTWRRDSIKMREYSMLPSVCSVTDHRWRQNVVRTKKWHTRRYWCSYHILTSSVICYWTDARQHGIYFFSYFFLLLVPVQCLEKTFLNFIFGQSRKILSYFSKLSAILKSLKMQKETTSFPRSSLFQRTLGTKLRRKNFVVMTSIVCLSSNRS